MPIWPFNKVVEALTVDPSCDTRANIVIDQISKVTSVYSGKDRANRIDWLIKRTLERRKKENTDDSNKEAILIWEKATNLWPDVITCEKPTPR